MSTDRSGIFALRLMSLTIAVFLWVFIAWENRGERPSERVVEAGVTYNPPPGVIILDPVERVRVRVRGPEEAVRQVNPYLVDVQVELENQGPGSVEIQLQPSFVILPDGVQAVSLEPTSIRLELDREIQRLFPVRAELTGEPAAGSTVVGRPRVRPAQLLASGPSTLLGSIDALRTSQISLDGHALDFEETTLVIAPDPLVKILNSPVVTVQVLMQQPQPLPEGGR